MPCNFPAFLVFSPYSISKIYIPMNRYQLYVHVGISISTTIYLYAANESAAIYKANKMGWQVGSIELVSYR